MSSRAQDAGFVNGRACATYDQWVVAWNLNSQRLDPSSNRFGNYTLNLDRKSPQPNYGFTLNRSYNIGLITIRPILFRIIAVPEYCIVSLLSIYFTSSTTSFFI